MDVSTSGLVAQRIRMDVIAGNIANAFTTADAAGRPNPYRRRVAVFAVGDPSRGRGAPGVHVQRIEQDPSEFRLEYDPGHPHAMRSGPLKGYVRYPNVDLATEMVNAVEAARAYEANVAAFEVSKTMLTQSLKLMV